MELKLKGIKTEKKKAWTAFSAFIRMRDALKTTGTRTEAVCYSCGKTYPAFGVGCGQAGHLIPGRGNSVLIDEIGVNFQCYNCNINLKGNWVGYERHFLQEHGQKKLDEMKAKKGQSERITAYEWRQIAEKYKQKLKELV
jgi:hypothetical protein